MSTWSDRPVCAFDLETTGPDPRTARIVTACVAMLTPSPAPSSSPSTAAPPVPYAAPHSVRTWLLNPGIPIPDGASAVHGISTAQAHGSGMDYRTGYAGIRAALQEAWDAGAVVVAFNASFDLTMVDAEGTRLGFPALAPALVADPYVIDREMDRYRRGKRTLGDVCRHYGVRLDNSHEAQADAVAAAHLLAALVSAYPDLSALDIVDAQTRWHAERQKSFAEYLTRTGRDASDVNGEWPIRRTP